MFHRSSKIISTGKILNLNFFFFFCFFKQMGSPGLYIESKQVKTNTPPKENGFFGILDKIANDKRLPIVVAVAAVSIVALRVFGGLK